MFGQNRAHIGTSRLNYPPLPLPPASPPLVLAPGLARDLLLAALVALRMHVSWNIALSHHFPPSQVHVAPRPHAFSSLRGTIPPSLFLSLHMRCGAPLWLAMSQAKAHVPNESPPVSSVTTPPSLLPSLPLALGCVAWPGRANPPSLHLVRGRGVEVKLRSLVAKPSETGA